ncbi:MAG: hypothetical protein IJ064_01655 [Bacteroidaceae bacterium]|nr:hypothetical protein [Bacteroidaceae bacterium]
MLKRIPYTLAFLIIALYVMMGPLQPYLLETGQLTPFLTTPVFFRETLIASSWGLFYYVAWFLQACMVKPWVGALLLVTLLTAIAYATRWVLRVSDTWFGLCWIIPFFFLSTYTEIGYEIYVSKKPAFVFFVVTPVLLGLLLVGSIRWLWILLKHQHDVRQGKTRQRFSRSANLASYVLSIVVFAAMGYYFWGKTYQDLTFFNILEMKQAAERNDWQRVLALARENKAVPTRLQVCLTRLALYKTGQMGDQLFAYPEGSANYNAPVQRQWLRLIGAPLLYYHYGKLGFAYRWAMEDIVEYGMRPADLRILHRVAMLNGEETLAEKYAKALQHTLFYHDEGTRIKQEAQTIRPLLNYTDQLDGDDGLVEFYLLQSFALTDGGSREMVELSLMCSLITKQLDGFWPRFMALLPTWKEGIPRHYQEAALMITQLQGGMETSQLPISDEVRQRFDRLVEASAQLGDDASNAYRLRPEFGDTYWYYYFFVEGMKTN